MLGKNQRRTLFKLFDVIALICAEDIDITSIDDLEQQVHRVLALLERDFPVSYSWPTQLIDMFPQLLLLGTVYSELAWLSMS